MPDFSLVSDTHGQIDEVIVQISADTLQDPGYCTAYENLLRDIGAKAFVVAVTSNSSVAQVDAWVRTLAPHHKTLAVDDTAFANSRVWARDAVLRVNKNAGGALFLRPVVSKPGPLDRWLADGLGVELRKLPKIALDGGDSLVLDDGHWLLGAGAVHSTIRVNRGGSWDDAVALIENEIGRKAIIAGFRRTDVDRYWFVDRMNREARRDLARLSLLQRFVNWLPSYARAAKIAVREFLSNGLHTDWLHTDLVVSATGRRDGDRPIVLVADPTLPQCPDSVGARRKGRRLHGLTEELERQGLKVIRNPAPYVHPDLLPYNNTIVQADEGTVWLPTFSSGAPGFKSADVENIRIWRHVLKFPDVRPIDGWSAFVRADGSIRCATLVRRR